MDYRAAGFWFAVGQGVFNVIVVIWMAISRKHQANNKRVKDLEDSNATKITEKKAKELIDSKFDGCADHRKRTERLEREISNMPSRPEIQRLNDNIGTLSQDIGKLQGQLGGVNRAVDLINQHLINQGGKQ